MKEWVSSWKASGKVRKQRKYQHMAPLHVRQHLLGAHLSKELRGKYRTRSLSVRVGDKVKVLRGSSRGKTGKVERVLLQKLRVFVGGVEIVKRDGSKVPYPLHPSNLLITELSADKRRMQKLEQRHAKARSA